MHPLIETHRAELLALPRRRVDVVTEASLHPALRERVVASAVPL
jgi:predicted nucleotidyltransferase